MKMVLKDGKRKVITLSYDDGVVQDIRLIEIMNRYGLKGTFNINTGKYLPEDAVRERFSGRLKLSEAIKLYKDSGHEVAVHTFSHPKLETLPPAVAVYEVTEDRRTIERQYGKITRGMAYPNGTYNEEVANVVGNCGIVYARTIQSTFKFDFPQNWLMLHPTCHHTSERLEELITRFLTLPTSHSRMFYLWGHSFEFDNDDNWEVIENFGKIAGGREDVWYATNIEIYDYVNAFKNLQISYDNSVIYNPSVTDVWFEENGKTYCVRSGETINI